MARRKEGTDTMHSYYVSIVPRDLFNGPSAKAFHRSAVNVSYLRRSLIKTYGTELQTTDRRKQVIIVVYKDQGHYVMSDPLGQLTVLNSPGVKWVTDKTAYHVNRDGTLGRRL